MTKDEALQSAINRLDDVQLADNTWREAMDTRKEIEKILYQLAEDLSEHRCRICGRPEYSHSQNGHDYQPQADNEQRVPFSGDPSELTSPFKSDLE